MTLFAWHDDLSVGNSFIDNDHRNFIALLNNLHLAMDEGKGQQVLETVLSDLIQYAQEHFKREEFVMQGMRYAEFLQHKQEHDKLTLKVLALRKKFIEDETKLTVELLMFL